MKRTEFFLGANSSEGFYSLYDQLFTDALADLLILKGSPGCGKSTMMKKIGAAAQAAGLDVHYIRCSGDPDSLDGIIVPALHSAVVDGTAPHVLEPCCAIARERYCDLSAGADVAGVKRQCRQIEELTAAYRAKYQSAYRILRAMGTLEREWQIMAAEGVDREKLHRRTEGILRREMKGKEKGRLNRVFLGGLTHAGRISTLESVMSLCPQIYLFSDQYALAEEELQKILSAALERGEDVLAGMDPDFPKTLRQLLLPKSGVAFVREDGKTPCPVQPYRHIRVDALAAEQLSRSTKAKLRFTRRILRSLEEEACGELRQAKTLHDALEALYRPYMDFSVAEEAAEREIRRLLG